MSRDKKSSEASQESCPLEWTQLINYGDESEIDEVLRHVFSCQKDSCGYAYCLKLKRQIIHALTCCKEGW